MEVVTFILEFNDSKIVKRRHVSPAVDSGEAAPNRLVDTSFLGPVALAAWCGHGLSLAVTLWWRQTTIA